MSGTTSPEAAARPAGPRTARLINDRRAYDLLLERGPLTRSDLRTLTGLSRPTVGDLVERLEAQGLIEQRGQTGADRRGPNATLYGVVADRAHVMGVEVRSDVVLAVVVDITGAEIGTGVVPQDGNVTPHELVSAAAERAIDEAGLRAGRLSAMVVGTPGLVDPETGDVSYVARLPTFHEGLLPALRTRFGIPVVVENEVNLVGLAEHRLGAARGRSTFALLWSSDAVGVAVVLSGWLYRGMSGGAGEVGYLPLGPAETLQTVAGGGAVRALARSYGVETADVETAALETVVAAGIAHGSGFPEALADQVALGAAAVCSVLDPGVLVLGGAVGRAGGAELAARVTDRVRTLTPLPTEVLTAAVEGNPVVRGAVLVALDTVHAELFGGS